MLFPPLFAKWKEPGNEVGQGDYGGNGKRNCCVNYDVDPGFVNLLLSLV